MQLCWTDVKKFKFKIFRSFWLLRNWTEKYLVRVILFAPLDEPIVSLRILKCIACYFFCFNWWPWTFCHCSNKEKADQILWTSTVLYFLSLSCIPIKTWFFPLGIKISSCIRALVLRRFVRWNLNECLVLWSGYIQR